MERIPAHIIQHYAHHCTGGKAPRQSGPQAHCESRFESSAVHVLEKYARRRSASTQRRRTRNAARLPGVLPLLSLGGTPSCFSCTTRRVPSARSPRSGLTPRRGSRASQPCSTVTREYLDEPSSGPRAPARPDVAVKMRKTVNAIHQVRPCTSWTCGACTWP